MTTGVPGVERGFLGKKEIPGGLLRTSQVQADQWVSDSE